ncbi:MAG: hypothetical protein PHR87_07835 [Sulfurospirillaceae bacterium]|nr:hypothetical protein [Sulfurospirillaceae bacterium]
MDSRLFEIDPLAAVNYGFYNTLKKGEGSFEDFLVHYDSHNVNEGDNSWLTKLVSEDMASKIASIEVLSTMDFLGMNHLNFLTKSSFFDTQVASYKLEILQEMRKKEALPANILNQFYQNLDTMTL